MLPRNLGSQGASGKKALALNLATTI